MAIVPERAVLYERCDSRFLAMMEAGAVAEVEALLGLGYDPRLPVMKTIGVAELTALIRGQLDRDRAVATAQMKTRRYAKRQLTWLRHQILRNDRNVMAIDTKDCESIDANFFNKIRQKVLTDGP